MKAPRDSDKDTLHAEKALRGSAMDLYISAMVPTCSEEDPLYAAKAPNNSDMDTLHAEMAPIGSAMDRMYAVKAP